MDEGTMVQANEPKAPKTCNKTAATLTIINIIMMLGLIILYFIILKPGKPQPVNQAVIQKASQGGITIAYVNSDSLMANYELVKTMRNTLEAKTKSLENELQRKQSAFEKDAVYFEEQVQKQTISEASAQEIYAQLMSEQQKLYQLREQYAAEISRHEYDLNLVLLDSLNNFLTRYNRKMNFDYIFSYTFGGSILSANDSLDITGDVLRELNAGYAKTAKK